MYGQFVILLLLASSLLAQESPLPASLSEDELSRLGEIGALRELTPPPDPGFTFLAEYEAADGVIFSWTNSYATLISELIAAVSHTDTAFVVIPNSGTQTTVVNLLNNNGADLTRVQFIIHNLNSVWMRDYGPWWGLDSYGRRGLVDFIYNRPRPLDDAFPQFWAESRGVPYYGPDLIHPGGNFIVDGHGLAFATTLLQSENNNYSTEDISQILHDYGGIDSLVMLTPMQNDGTGHIDMFCKLLNDSTFIVGEYANPNDGSGNNYNILNQNAERLAGLTSVTGNPFRVERIHMPPYSGGISYTYTNSLIVNNTVLVPVYGFDTDTDALNLYRNLMPDYNVLGFDSNIIIPANGAIHCIVKLVMSEAPLDCIAGDLNQDLQVNIQDLVILVQLILGNLELTPSMFCAGDLNGDELLSVQDVILLVQRILG